MAHPFFLLLVEICQPHLLMTNDTTDITDTTMSCFQPTPVLWRTSSSTVLQPTLDRGKPKSHALHWLTLAQTCLSSGEHLPHQLSSSSSTRSSQGPVVSPSPR